MSEVVPVRAPVVGWVPESMRELLDVAARVAPPCAGSTLHVAPGSAAGVARAVAMCERCLLLELCRRAAVDARVTFGVWGGVNVGKRVSGSEGRRRRARSVSAA